MTVKLGVLMDPIESINPKKDSTLAMMLAAKKRGWSVYYFTQHDLYLDNKKVSAKARLIDVEDNPQQWFSYLTEAQDIELASLDIVLMRKDPPFDIEYVYTTHLLELAEQQGVVVVNKPQSLRDFNEKLITAHFPDCAPTTIVSRDIARLKAFWQQHNDVVFKPLEGMGGSAVFRVNQQEVNLMVILDLLTQKGQRYIMAQQFIPEITQGDKRILMVNGEAIPFALARIPAKGETRGNLAAGAKGVGVELSKRDKAICKQVGPFLRQHGIIFAGLDVIGDYLTEVNITSPTCIREIDSIFSTNIATELLDRLEPLIKK